MSFVHFFFARTILGFLKVEERVIDLALEYIAISVFSLLVNIDFLINQKHLVLIEKPKINFYIINYIFFQFDYSNCIRLFISSCI